MSLPGSDWQLCVVWQVWSKSSQVREEAWRTVCRASENSRVCTEHSLTFEWSASQGESLSWIAELFTMRTWVRWRQSFQGDNSDRAELVELRQTATRLRMAQAPSDRS